MERGVAAATSVWGGSISQAVVSLQFLQEQACWIIRLLLLYLSRYLSMGGSEASGESPCRKVACVNCKGVDKKAKTADQSCKSFQHLLISFASFMLALHPGQIGGVV